MGNKSGWAVEPRFSRLKLKEITPKGWVLEQMKRDMSEGFQGVLDELTVHAKNDIFLNRIKETYTEEKILVGELGWWDGETRGNWLDGYIRMAFYSENQAAWQRMIDYLQQVLDSQDDDGYIGMYDPPVRFNHEFENGEFWVMSRILLIMLAAYEFTGDNRYLAATEKAIQCVIREYGPGKKDYWTNYNKKDSHGVAHGLQITDVLEWLFALTGKDEYRDFALWCWKNYSESKDETSPDDYYIGHLLDPDYVFKIHAAHAAEHLRVPLLAYYLSGDEMHRKAYMNAYEKIAKHELMTGSVIGEEHIAEREPATDAGYEYCTTLEYLDSLLSVGQKTGDGHFGDKVETLMFNAAQGNRTPDGKHVNYVACEDAYDKSLQEGRAPGAIVATWNHTYKYSPTHEDVAVCCNPNAGKILSYFVNRMWMKVDHGEHHGLVAYVYGPCTVSTKINGIDVTIEEETQYPFEDEVTFTVNPKEATRFSIWLRNPDWSGDTAIVSEGAEIKRHGGYFVVTKTWNPGDSIRMVLATRVKLEREYANFVHRGPLIFAVPIEGDYTSVKKYSLDGFDDFYLKAKDQTIQEQKIVVDDDLPDCGFEVYHDSMADVTRPWDNSPIKLKRGDLTLVPYGCTLLRRCSFDTAE